MTKKRLWGGVYEKPPHELAWRFGQSVASDAELVREEIEVSIAHAEMLLEQAVIPAGDAGQIVRGLKGLLQSLDSGRLELPKDAEDIHAAVEHLLREQIGPAADHLHAGRSRNDQIATVTKLWLRRRCSDLRKAVKELQGTLVAKADAHRDAVMPGYTHQQPAQPITVGFHLLAHFWALQRDGVRLQQLQESLSSCPLGSAALAGTSLPVDRHAVAQKLGFAAPPPNALDAVSDRDFVGDALHACATLMQHLSRLCQELVLWSSPAFGFLTLDESVTTGSSIMPQKRNPDMAELIRGRAARVIGHWTAFMAMMKALPLGYSRDMQDDKPPLFESARLCLDSLVLTETMVRGIEYDTERMQAAAGEGFSTATGVAEELVKAGMSFREAHETTGGLVRACEDRGLALNQLTLELLAELGFEHLPEPALVLKATGVRESIASRSSYGGPSPERLREQIEHARSLLNLDEFTAAC